MLTTNVQNAYQNYNISLTDFSNTDINLGGVAQTFESMLDDMFLGLSSDQPELFPNGTVVIPAKATVNAIRIGNAIYIYSITALNFIVMAIFAVEAFRHQDWKQLGRFNYSNLAHARCRCEFPGRRRHWESCIGEVWIIACLYSEPDCW